ncbi:hypothetical protein AAF712_003096 [Marasmius tenuissimus]|uniref:F-box domain-containing protein n=1 Tax=Marasmius tenuissimus TaxID=585030 RepID=A0ABR3A903_9AGAR
MDWKKDFKKAVQCFKSSKFDEALEYLNKAIDNGGHEEHVVFDSRSAVYAKLGETRLAILDAKKVIQLGPARWQGYTRAARLFFQVNRFAEAQTMADAALRRVPPDDQKNRTSLLSLVSEIKDTRRRTTCHINTLPYELLSEIFQYLVNLDHTNTLLVSRTSKHFRDIALHSPALWGTLVLSNKSPVRKTSWWIEKSKGRIKELHIRRGVLDDSKWALDLLEGIQWRNLRVLRLEDIDLTDYLTKHKDVDGFLPSLEEIDIRDKLLDTSRDPFVSQIASQARRLTLEGSYVKLDRLTSTSLTHLTLRRTTGCHSRDLPALLAANPDLQELCVDVILAETRAPPSSRIALPNLKTLEACSPTQIFQCLSAPALTVVRVRQSMNIDPFLTNLIQNNTTLLTELSIMSCGAATPIVLELLRMNPSLNTLVLNLASANPVVEALASSTLCPALTHIDVSHCPDIQTGPLHRLVKSRLAVEVDSETLSGEGTSSQRPAPIDTIRVDGCPRIESDFIPWFRQRVPTFSCVYMTKKAASWKR